MLLLADVEGGTWSAFGHHKMRAAILNLPLLFVSFVSDRLSGLCDFENEE